MKKIVIHIEKIRKDALLPKYMTEDASGMDLFAALERDTIIKPLERVLIPTGIRTEIPRGYELQVRPRSGLAWNHGIGILNAPGTIDSDYRGEIKVILINLSNVTFTVRAGDRIAQMVISKVQQADVKIVRSVSVTRRGDGGFGHTGV